MVPDKRVTTKVRIWVGIVAGAAFAALLLPDAVFGLPANPTLLNGIIAFAALGVLSETFFLKISFSNVGTSVAFVPLIASVALFAHPWPMLIAGGAVCLVDTLVRKKEPIRVVFNVAQYMLAVGLGGVVYGWLGGLVSLTEFHVDLVPFLGLVVTFFLVNTGTVAIAVALSNGLSARETWDRIVGKYVVGDLIASFLAMLLVFVYVELQIIGLVIVILPLFFIRHIYQINAELERKNEELLEVLVERIEASDPYTSGHSRRVAEFARILARELGQSARQVDQIAKAALLHDVGKAYAEFATLLRKETRLTPEERIIMQSHPVRSAELVGRISDLRGVVQDAVRHHHENFDGTGYPDGLAGELIPLGARIIMLADTLDAMTTDRPYRRALSFERVVEEIRKYSGRQFDPQIAAVMLQSTAIRRLVESEPSVNLQLAPVAEPLSIFKGGRAPASV
jgi:putative nucleotidyltransferase with HDIG domain